MLHCGRKGQRPVNSCFFALQIIFIPPSPPGHTEWRSKKWHRSTRLSPSRPMRSLRLFKWAPFPPSLIPILHVICVIFSKVRVLILAKNLQESPTVSFFPTFFSYYLDLVLTSLHFWHLKAHIWHMLSKGGNRYRIGKRQVS